MLQTVQYISIDKTQEYSFQHVWCFLCIIVISGSISDASLEYKENSFVLFPYDKNGLTIRANENSNLIFIYDFHILEKICCAPIKKAFNPIFVPLYQNIPQNPFIKKIDYCKVSVSSPPKFFPENTLLFLKDNTSNNDCILNQVFASEPLVTVSSKCLDSQNPYFIISKPVWISFITSGESFITLFIIYFYNLL